MSFENISHPPQKKTAQTFLLTEGKRPSFAMVCWFARLALWSHVRRFCPFPVLSINTWAGRHIRAFAPAVPPVALLSPRYLPGFCLKSTRVTMTEYPRQDSLNNRHLFSDRPGRQKHTSRFEPIWFLVRTLCLACRQPSSCYVHAWPFLHATSWPGLTSDMPWKVPSLSTATQGLGPQHRDLGRTHTFRP